jgi:hypothetical protein
MSKKVKNNHFIHHRMPLVTSFHLPATHKNIILWPLYDVLQNPHHKLALIPPTPYNIATSHSHNHVKKVKNHLKHHIMRPLVTPFHLPATHKSNILWTTKALSCDPCMMVCRKRHHELTCPKPPTPYNIATPHSHSRQKGQKSLHTPHHETPRHTLPLTRNA